MRLGLRLHHHRERIRAAPRIGFAYRAVVAVVGAGVVTVGIVALPLPGPGWLIIFFGLGILASEFEWARRLLVYARERVEAWTDWVRRQSRLVRLALALATLVALAGAAVGYVAWRGVPSWLPGAGRLGIG